MMNELISGLLRDDVSKLAWQTSPEFRAHVTDFANLLEFIMPILAREALNQQERLILKREAMKQLINMNMVKSPISVEDLEKWESQKKFLK